MNLHEYQAKELMSRYGVPIQRGKVASTVDEAVQAFEAIRQETGSQFAVIKAQIHAGGRGKGGGVKLAKNLDEIREHATNILGMMLKTPQTPGGLEGPGKLVSKIFVAEDCYTPDFKACKEYYVSILLDREKKSNAIIYSTEGGMDIEEVAEHTPEKIYKEWVDPALGLQPFQARNMAFKLGLSGDAFKNFVKFIANVYNAYVGADCSLIEINPCLENQGQIIAVDGKITIDDNSLFRQPVYAAMHDELEDDPAEVEAAKFDLNYVKLDGNVGCMVNGAGLAMATMDIIKLSGGEPANFLDVGGTADAKRVENAFDIILKDTNVKAILINIFGGIVRCDRVAQGIVDAYRSMGDRIKVPIIVRLQGTNADVAKKLIDESGLKVRSVIALHEAAAAVNEVLKEA
jgi:succinyl-CoA synthetase beta subunit